MAIDCSIYPGSQERPLPDQPGGGKVRIGAGGTPIVFTGNKCENNFSNCAGSGAALGANVLYSVPSQVLAQNDIVYLSGGLCVELDSTGCVDQCLDTIEVRLDPSSCGGSPTTYTLSAGHLLPTGYMTCDVVSTGITGDYSCWWGAKFSPQSYQPDADPDLSLFDITLAKNPVFVEVDSGVLQEISGGWVLMIRYADSSTCSYEPEGVYYYDGPKTDNISGSYNWLGLGPGGGINANAPLLGVEVLTNYTSPAKPCPRIEYTIPSISSLVQSYRFNKCEISAFKMSPLNDAIYEIYIDKYLAGSNLIYLRFYGEDESFTYQVGSTVISEDGRIVFSYFLEKGKDYYFTLQNQDPLTNRFSYNIYYQEFGAPGWDNGNPMGPINGSPLDSISLCPCISSSFDLDVFIAPSPGGPFVDANGPPAGIGGLAGPLGTAIIGDYSDYLTTTCPCPGSTIPISAFSSYPIEAPPIFINLTGVGANAGAFEYAINPILDEYQNIFSNASCYCVSGGESDLITSIDVYPEEISEYFIDLSPSPAASLDALVVDISSGIIECDCDGESAYLLTVDTAPISSTSIYISGGLEYQDIMDQLYCQVLGECSGAPSAAPGGGDIPVVISGIDTEFDFINSSYDENGASEYYVADTGIINGVCINLEGYIDQYPAEITIEIRSPTGTIYTIDGDPDLGNDENYTYFDNTDVFDGEEMQGYWIVDKIDSFGDGGVSVYDTSTIIINPSSC